MAPLRPFDDNGEQIKYESGLVEGGDAPAGGVDANFDFEQSPFCDAGKTNEIRQAIAITSGQPWNVKAVAEMVLGNNYKHIKDIPAAFRASMETAIRAIEGQGYMMEPTARPLKAMLSQLRPVEGTMTKTGDQARNVIGNTLDDSTVIVPY